MIDRGLVGARHLAQPTAEELSKTYGMAMVVLFRILFITYAVDKDLLPPVGSKDIPLICWMGLQAP